MDVITAVAMLKTESTSDKLAQTVIEQYVENSEGEKALLISICEELLTWCCEPDKKLIYKQKLEKIKDK